MPLLFQCVKDPVQEVRQSAFALLGDVAKCCIVRLSFLLLLTTTTMCIVFLFVFSILKCVYIRIVIVSWI